MNTKFLLLLAGIAGVVWYAESQQSAAATPGTPAAGTAPPTPSGTTTTAAASAPTAPVYQGPSLAQMYSGLQQAVANALGNDPALSCPAGMSGLGVGTGSRTATVTFSDPVTGSQVPLRGGHPAVVGGGIAPRSTTPTACDPTTVSATYEVFNYYLLQAVPGVTIPNAPAGNPTTTLAQYWAWASPQLQAATPGLSGFAPVYMLARPKVARSYATGGWGA